MRIPVVHLLFLLVFVLQRRIGSSVIAAASTTTNNDSDSPLVLRAGERPSSIQLFRNSAFISRIRKSIDNLAAFFQRLLRILLFQPQRSISSNSTTTQYIPNVKEWGGKSTTPKEVECIRELRNKIPSSNARSKWLDEVSDAELLRFVRMKKGNVQETWQKILNHVAWRKSDRGADSTKYDYSKSNLHYEIFWLGEDKRGCPTLVVRTQVHDGIDYNEDPKLFTGFMVAALEEGKRKYGVGVTKQMCLILDRGGTVIRSGKKKIEKRDFSAIPNLVTLFRHLFNTIIENYPDMLDTSNVAPASRFFSLCYKITGRIMDKHNRDKFKMIHENDVPKVFGQLFPAISLPPHLGGSSTTYTSIVNVP